MYVFMYVCINLNSQQYTVYFLLRIDSLNAKILKIHVFILCYSKLYSQYDVCLFYRAALPSCFMLTVTITVTLMGKVQIERNAANY